MIITRRSSLLRYPLLREAMRVFKRGGDKALEKWVSSLNYEEKYRLASNMITILARQSGRDPAEVALELLKGKGGTL